MTPRRLPVADLTIPTKPPTPNPPLARPRRPKRPTRLADGPDPTTTYPVLTVASVITGSDYALTVPLGFGITATVRFRLIGYSTPDPHSPNPTERSAATRARGNAHTWLNLTGPLTVTTRPGPEHGVYWADLDRGGESLGEYLERLDLATRWPLHWKDTH